MASRLVVGCMSGTSVDGLDAALVAIEGRGLALQPRLLAHLSRPLGELGTALREFADQRPLTAGRIAALLSAFADEHVKLVRELLGQQRADLVAVHGQTVFHQPPLSWQMFAAAPLVAALGTPVVFDLRAADLAAGGQGAPITPLADFMLFRDAAERRAIVNLGGFANFTGLPPCGESADSAVTALIRGGDICVCNQLLNRIARQGFGEPYDPGGRRAAAALPDPGLAPALRSVLEGHARGGRSLGTGDEAFAWADAALREAAADVVLRTAADEIGRAIAGRLDPDLERIVLAGGGARNAALVAAITAGVRVPVVLSDALGVPLEAREAAEMAVLGALCADRVPITLPQVTGVPSPAPLSGLWAYP